MKNNITRRDVMGCTAKVAGAFLALPYLLTRGSFANAATGSTLVNEYTFSTQSHACERSS